MEIQRSDGVFYVPASSCEEWRPLQNIIFHVCMIAYFIAFAIPQNFKQYAPTLRAFILIAVFLNMIWGAMYWCTCDVLIWGAVFFLQNFVQLLYALYKFRRVQFSSEFEELYTEVFQPFDVTRREFRALINHNCKTLHIHPGDRYAVEGCTTVDERVSLLVSGRMQVEFRGKYLHGISCTEMIDSVEWGSSKLNRGDIFQVTVFAVDECCYLCWKREKLQFYLEANPKLHTVFEYLRGHDILKKIHGTAVSAYRRNLKNTGGPGETTKQAGSISITNIRQGHADEDPSVIYSTQ